MLQKFLNRIASHPILSTEHVFHRFLDGEVSWVRFDNISFNDDRIHGIDWVERSVEFPSDLLVAEEHLEGTIS